MATATVAVRRRPSLETDAQAVLSSATTEIAGVDVEKVASSRFEDADVAATMSEWRSVEMVWRFWKHHRRRRRKVTTSDLRKVATHIERMSSGFTKLISFFIWLAFLISVVLLQSYPPASWGMATQYRADYSMQESIMGQIENSEYLHHDVNNIASFWDWITSLTNELYDNDKTHSASYDAFAVATGVSSTESTGYVASHNKFYSVMFVTQARREMAECVVPSNQKASYSSFIPVCYSDTKDETSYVPDVMAPYVHVPVGSKGYVWNASTVLYNEVAEAFTYDPKLATTGGFGLLLDLGGFHTKKEHVLAEIDQAKSFGWVDKQTSAVTISLMTMNANIGLVNKLVITYTIDLSGHYRTDQRMTSLDMTDRYDSTLGSNSLRITMEVLLIVATFLIALGEVREFCNSPSAYLGNWTNAIDWINVGAVIFLFFAWFSRCMRTAAFRLPEDHNLQINGFSSAFRTTIEESQHELDLIAESVDFYEWISFINMIVAVLCMLKNTLFHHQLGVLGRTLCNKAELTNLLSFTAIFVMINLIFAFFCAAIFGRRSASFKSTELAFASLMRWFFGDFAPLDELQEAYKPLDSTNEQRMVTVAFWTYVIVCFVMAQNILLAIVVNSYMDLWEVAKEEKLPPLFEEVAMTLHYTRCCVTRVPFYRTTRRILKKRKTKAKAARVAARRSAKVSPTTLESDGAIVPEASKVKATKGTPQSRTSATHACVESGAFQCCSKLFAAEPFRKLSACSGDELNSWMVLCVSARNLVCFPCDVFAAEDLEDALADVIEHCEAVAEGHFRVSDVERILSVTHSLRPWARDRILARLWLETMPMKESAADSTLEQVHHLVASVASLQHELDDSRAARKATDAKLDAILAALSKQS